MSRFVAQKFHLNVDLGDEEKLKSFPRLWKLKQMEEMENNVILINLLIKCPFTISSTVLISSSLDAVCGVIADILKSFEGEVM